jgi:hypothetical protein
VYRGGDRSLAFLCNDDDKPANVSFEGGSYHLPGPSVVILSDGKAVMNTAEVESSCVLERTMRPVKSALASFETWAEPTPEDRPEEPRAETVADSPVEQLTLTGDRTDYCWYSVRLNVPKPQAGEGTLTLDRAADMVYVFVDGKLAAPAIPPAKEDRGPTDSDAYKQEFHLKLSPGPHDLSLLCCSLGLIKGDWMLGKRNMVEERKGLWGPVRWDGKELRGPWRMQPGLVGERCRLFAEGAALAKWRPPRAGCVKPMTWLRTTFRRAKGDAPIALDMAGMGKGLAWVNGNCIGRYWLLPAGAEGAGWLSQWTEPGKTGRPTQRYYHVPSDWLRERNVLVLFEEMGGDAGRIRVCQRA